MASTRYAPHKDLDMPLWASVQTLLTICVDGVPASRSRPIPVKQGNGGLQPMLQHPSGPDASSLREEAGGRKVTHHASSRLILSPLLLNYGQTSLLTAIAFSWSFCIFVLLFRDCFSSELGALWWLASRVASDVSALCYSIKGGASIFSEGLFRRRRKGGLRS